MPMNQGPTMSQLLAGSFRVIVDVTPAGLVLLPEKLHRLMGEHLKGDLCKDPYLLVSKLDDAYYVGKPLPCCEKGLQLDSVTRKALGVCDGGSVVCAYNGCGGYFTVKNADAIQEL